MFINGLNSKKRLNLKTKRMPKDIQLRADHIDEELNSFVTLVLSKGRVNQKTCYRFCKSVVTIYHFYNLHFNLERV